MEKLGSRYLMMIEPKVSDYDVEPIHDRITAGAIQVWQGCKATGVEYRGHHVTHDGTVSDNKQWLTPCGRETNSLLIHYVKHYRRAIPDSEIFKLGEEWGTLVRLKAEEKKALPT